MHSKLNIAKVSLNKRLIQKVLSLIVATQPLPSWAYEKRETPFN